MLDALGPFLSLDMVDLVLYAFQQFGVMLGVGAETIMLALYILAMRDRAVSEEESRFARAVRRALSVSLFVIILSGLAITGLHIFLGEINIVLSPAFVFKWGLIALIFFEEALTSRIALPNGAWVGLAGATWYALFLVHIIAPVISFVFLFILYGMWLVGFNLCWMALVFGTRWRAGSPSPIPKKPYTPYPQPLTLTPTPEPKAQPMTTPQPVAVPTPMYKPVPSVSAGNILAAKTQQPVITKKVEDIAPAAPLEQSGLPAVRVMPKSPVELKQ